MIQVGLDQLVATSGALRDRRYGVVAHAAAVSSDLLPIHLALTRSGNPSPVRMFAPEHGFFGIEQDMVASGDGVDPWLGVPIHSLYGTAEESLRPTPDAFENLDVLVVDLQDAGTRFYTYAATAVWAARAALAAGCEVWVLDRPNPLGGMVVEGNLRSPGFESFVGAFPTPVRHGLTLGELVTWALGLEQVDLTGLTVWRMEGWRRSMVWGETGRPWIAPSPNLPSWMSAQVYPGGCLVEATSASEGRGTTRPFELIGSPTVEPMALADRLNSRGLAGARFLPVFFRPQFQKHQGLACGGVQWVVEDASLLRPYRCGIEIVRALRDLDPEFSWRREAYEFVADRPAIDLLTGSDAFRLALESGDSVDGWLASWHEDARRFRESTEACLLYVEAEGEG